MPSPVFTIRVQRESEGTIEPRYRADFTMNAVHVYGGEGVSSLRDHVKFRYTARYSPINPESGRRRVILIASLFREIVAVRKSNNCVRPMNGYR